MKYFKTGGWFYLFTGVCSAALFLLYHDLSIRFSHLIVYSGVYGYVAGMALYSLSDIVRHGALWLIDYKNYRFYFRHNRRKKKMFRLRLTPLSR